MKKIKIRTILAAILAVIIGILVYIYLGSLRQEVNIYIATTDITKGTILNEMVLKETAPNQAHQKEDLPSRAAAKAQAAARAAHLNRHPYFHQ